MTKRAPAPVSISPRPPRGTAEETRARLVTVASIVFNRDGYDGTDTNRIAREAGYAPATFYKHFEDKKQVFLAAYEGWVRDEWQGVRALLERGGPPDRVATALVAEILEHHVTWRVFRASLRALLPIDPDVRAFRVAQRRKQLEFLEDLRKVHGGPASSREADALLLFTLERTCDALAEGETRSLGLRDRDVEKLLEGLVRARLAPSGG